MMGESAGSTPLWIPFDTFETKDECVSFVQLNQIGLFERAIQQYEGKIPPQQISCVDKDRLESVLGNKPLVGSETGV